LGIQDIVHGHQVIIFTHGTRANSTEFLHVSTNTEQKTHVHTERSNVRSSLTRDPEDGEVTVIVEFNEFHVVNGSNAELSLDGRDERRALEESSGESLNCL
jgi:hypothetical protein